jgi:hypothetical protein
MKFHSSCLHPLPQGSPGDGSSLRCGEIHTVLPPSLPDSSNTVPGHSKLDCNSGYNATMPAECCKRDCKIRILSPLLSGWLAPASPDSNCGVCRASVLCVAATAAFIIELDCCENLNRARTRPNRLISGKINLYVK